MSIERTRTIARMAMLEMGPEEEARFTKELDAIFGYVSQLEKVAGTAPTEEPAGMALQADEPGTCFTAEVATSGAPARRGALFAFPELMRSKKKEARTGAAVADDDMDGGG